MPLRKMPVKADNLHREIAKVLGWKIEDTYTFSLQSLRDLVRPVSPALAREISQQIQSGADIVGDPLKPKRRWAFDLALKLAKEHPDFRRKLIAELRQAREKAKTPDAAKKMFERYKEKHPGTKLSPKDFLDERADKEDRVEGAPKGTQKNPPGSDKLIQERKENLQEKLPKDLKKYPPDTSIKDLDPEHREELEGYNLAVVGKDAAQAIAIARQLKEGIDKSADICKLAPPVCQGNKGLTRDKMPQIEGELSVKKMNRSDEERIQSETFKHPTEKGKDGAPKKVKFDALPEKEQEKLKKDWAEQRGKAKAMIEAGADPNEDRTTLQQLLDTLQKDGGVGTTETDIAVGRLKATQKEIKAAKTFGMADAHLKGKFDHIGDSVVVSRDGHILDGHHRWAALMTIDPTRKMKVKVVDMDMDDLLAEAAAYPGVYKANFAGEPLSKEEQKAYKEQNKSKIKKPSRQAREDLRSLQDRVHSFWNDLESTLKRQWPGSKMVVRGEYQWKIFRKMGPYQVRYDIDGDGDGNFELSVVVLGEGNQIIDASHSLRLKPTIPGIVAQIEVMSNKLTHGLEKMSRHKQAGVTVAVEGWVSGQDPEDSGDGWAADLAIYGKIQGKDLARLLGVQERVLKDHLEKPQVDVKIYKAITSGTNAVSKEILRQAKLKAQDFVQDYFADENAVVEVIDYASGSSAWWSIKVSIPRMEVEYEIELESSGRLV